MLREEPNLQIQLCTAACRVAEAVLADEHEGREKDGLQRYNHRQEPIGERGRTAVVGLPRLRTSRRLLYIGADSVTYSLLVICEHAHTMILVSLVLRNYRLYTSRNSDSAWY